MVEGAVPDGRDCIVGAMCLLLRPVQGALERLHAGALRGMEAAAAGRRSLCAAPALRA